MQKDLTAPIDQQTVDRWQADRGGVTSPPFPELTLRDGEPLDSPLFPQVWPRG